MSIRTDLSNAEYHALPFLSKSQLDDLDRSPYIFWQRHRNPNRPPKPEPTPAMLLGTMVHTAVLEPHLFWDQYKIAPKIDRRTKEGKLEYELMMRDLKPGTQLIDNETALLCDGMRLSLSTIAPIAELLSKGHAEVSAFWTDMDTGINLRCRPDWIHPVGDNGAIILDVKTTADASPEGFAKSVVNFNYRKQASLYSDGWARATGQHVHAFVFAAVEKTWPYAAAAYMLTEEDLEQGRMAYRRNLKTYAKCMSSGEWPGYATDIQLLTLPAWAKKETEE